MLNHARCLLANLGPFNEQPSSYVAEELIDPAFVPLTLPAPLVAVRKVLFGVAPDRDMVNYRARQLLTLVHASDLVEFVYDLDPRVTYSTGEDAALLTRDTFLPQVTSVTGAAPLSVFGTPDAPDRQGVVARSYVVTVLDAGSVAVHQTGQPTAVYDYEMRSGASTPFPLPGSGYQAWLPTDAAGSAWFVEVRNRPQWDLGQLVVTLGSLGEAVVASLFAGPEPFVSLHNGWRYAGELPTTLGSAVVALVLRSEEVRNATG
jgi:hypothetical protein